MFRFGAGGESLERYVSGFNKLVDILRQANTSLLRARPKQKAKKPQRGQEVVRVAEKDKLDHEKIEMAAKMAEEESTKQHEELRAIQSEIQRQVASFEALENQCIVSLQELPDEIKKQMQTRDLMRSRHAEQGRSMLQNMLQVIGCSEFKGHAIHHASASVMADAANSSRKKSKGKGKGKKDGGGGGGEEQAGAEEKPQEGDRAAGTDSNHVLLSDSKTWSDLETNVLKYMQTREDDLKVAIDAARDSREAYNQSQLRIDAGLCLMGAGSSKIFSSTVTTSELHNEVLMFYDTWCKSYLGNALAEESNKAMEDLKAALADEKAVEEVLGLTKKNREDNKLEQAFISAGSAIANERQHQLQDALGVFPSRELMSAGQQLFQAWQVERAAVQHLLQVARMLQKDIRVNEQSLRGEVEVSTNEGEPSIWNRDLLVQEIQAARKVHRKAIRTLSTLTPLIAEGDEDEIRAVAQALGLRDLPSMDMLRRDVSKALNESTGAMLKLTGDMQQHFPEVILFIGKGLPSELGLIWQPSQSLDTFDEKERVVSNESRHGIWRVRLGDAWFAIKEYSIRDAGDLQTCLREAALIYRQRHHAIVEIKALFQDVDRRSIYMQMPWYEHESLQKWVIGDQRPGWAQVRSVLLDALHGLAHLHEHLIIHGDMKPDNILIDRQERGRLADFDISIDAKERTSAVRVMRNMTTPTIRATALGMTIDFAAPELITSGQATKRTDMFAYGKTVASVSVHCEPPVDQAEFTEGQTAEFVKWLTSEDSEMRLPARDATCSPFFEVLRKVHRKVTRTCLFCESMGEESAKDFDAGIECSEGHFHCSLCVVKLTQDLLKVENRGKCARLDAQIMCFKYPTECRSSAFHDRDLARHLPGVDFQAYLKGRINLMEQSLKMELEPQIREQLKEEQRRLAALEERERQVLIARKHIEEEILQMKCPRQSCRQAFYDFDGCFALSCSLCPCKFCGWCLQDCGDQDAHPHVLICGKVPGGEDPLFPQMPNVRGAFEWAHKQRCRERVDAYLQGLDEDIYGDMKRSIQGLL